MISILDFFYYICHMKKHNLPKDAIKAAKKAARDEEIAMHGKSICYAHIEKSKKTYDRKKFHIKDIYK